MVTDLFERRSEGLSVRGGWGETNLFYEKESRAFSGEVILLIHSKEYRILKEKLGGV